MGNGVPLSHDPLWSYSYGPPSFHTRQQYCTPAEMKSKRLHPGLGPGALLGSFDVIELNLTMDLCRLFKTQIMGIKNLCTTIWGMEL